jgi:hypothetical protein
LAAGPLIAALVSLVAVKDMKDREMILPFVGGFAALGFVVVLLLFVRDALQSLRDRSSIAGLTPTGFVEGAPRCVAGTLNDATVLADIVRVVGRPPRQGLLTPIYRTPVRPGWCGRHDLIRRIYDEYPAIIHRGEVRWAAVIHANNTLHAPGDGDSGAQVVYAPDGASLAQVRAWASVCYAVKNTTPADPAVRRIADMLTDELERALDWPVPATLGGGANAITTVVMLPRKLLPLGFLTCPFFPVFADPVTKMAVVVPSGWWPASLVNLWIAMGQYV